MIRYTLRCDRDHEFEAWFQSSAAYDRAARAGENRCAVCGSPKVEKAIMAPTIGGGARPGSSDRMTLATVDPRQKAVQQALREFRQKVTENADYVGNRFPDEARKIHYEEIPARGIYGEATPDEAQSLAEEGVQFQPLPPLPEKAN
jgi:hypothetical protein